MGPRRVIVLDTHAWLWWVSGDSSLSRKAETKIRAATRIAVSAVSCLEVAVAEARGRIVLDRPPLIWMEQALALPRVELVPLTPAVAVRASRLGRDFPGDPADRVVVATALLESAVLVTRDARIREYQGVETAW
jgi:PIN domain nuclease of toxin-antitoxin system